VNIKNMKEALPYLFKAQLTPFLWGHAGVGKSTAVKQYAEANNYKFFPFYLGTQSDIGDILGLAEFVNNGDGSKSTAFATPQWLMNTITYCLENPDSGAVIFLDEFNRARRDILSGIFSLALDKTFHTIKLPENCHIIAAGNPPTDDYQVTDVDETALMARFVHVKLEPTVKEWLEYAEAKKLEPSLIGFIRDQPQLLEGHKLQDFNLPVKVDRRAYERLSRLFYLKTPQHLMNDLMPGIIGLERAVAYQQYMKETDKPLTGEQVLLDSHPELIEKWSNPENVQASFLNITRDNLKESLKLKNDAKLNLTDKEKDNLTKFLTTIPKDIAVIMVDDMVKSRNMVFIEYGADKKHEKVLINLTQEALKERSNKNKASK
jgi:hypothetical protein